MNPAWYIHRARERLEGLKDFSRRFFSRGWLGLLTPKERAAGLFLAAVFCWGAAGLLVESRRRAAVRAEPPEDLYLNLLRALPDMDSLVVWPEELDWDAEPGSEEFFRKFYSSGGKELLPVVQYLWWREYYSRLNINTATAEELVALPGIGPVLAGRILDYRQKRGEFFSIKSLMNVRGISRRKYGRIKDSIRAY